MWKWRKNPPPNIPEIRMEILAPSEEVPAQSSLCQELSPDSSGQETVKEKKNSLSDQLQQTSPVSPTPSADRLSVSFGPEVFSFGGSSTRSSLGSSVRLSMVSSPESNPSDTRVRFSKDYLTTNTDDNDDDDDEYNANLEAVMQRRYSKRRSSIRKSPSRRLSSPFGSDGERNRRRSSTMTIASGETQISMEDDIPEEEIMENIRMHKDVLESVKTQAWKTRKKIKVARQAKEYVKKHEGLLEQKLAQSNSTKDIMARYKLIFLRHSAKLKRDLSNLAALMVPWEHRIKRIECHFGSSVASYFTFLRWIFWINIIISIIIGCFIIIPEVLAADRKSAGDRKELLPDEEESAFYLHSIWEFEGWLKYSPIFYGYYTNTDKTQAGYRLPFAYFMASIGMYAYSFWAILKRMAENSRMSKMSEKDEECTFTWKLFTGWDYMIGNSETSQNKVASLVMGFKEVVLEEQEKQKEGRNWKVITCRVIANLLVISLLAASAYAVVKVVERSQMPDAESSWMRKNELQVVLTAISTVYPNLFEIIGLMESFHPRVQLQLQLSRIWVLNMLNLYTLNLALFDKVDKMSVNLTSLMPNTTTPMPTTTILYSTPAFNATIQKNATGYNFANISDPFQNCTEIKIPCDNITLATTPFYSLINYNSTLGDGTVDPIQEEQIDGNDIYNHLPNLTALNDINSSFLLNTKVSISNNETDWTFSELEFGTKINPNMKSMSLIFLPPDLLAKYNLTNDSTVDNISLSGFNETGFMLNMSDLSATINKIISQWFTSTVLPDIVDTKNLTNVTMTIKSSVQSIPDEDNEIPTLEPPAELTTVTSISFTYEFDTVSPSDEVCEVTIRVCPETEPPDYYSDTDTYPTTDIVTAWTANVTSVCENCTTYVTTIDDRGIISMCLDKTICYEVDMDTRTVLRKLCWETMFGQEIVRLTTMDLVFSCVMTVIMDFIRAVIVRYMNRCCCWDLEKNFPGYGDFKIAENILHLINNQGMIWMGTFFSPGLPIINTVKLLILFYIRSWAVLTCNVPHETVFRASRSNNFYYALLLTMLFLCTLPVSYAVIWLRPSWHCGPFSGYAKIFHILTKSIKSVMPDVVNRALDYLTSASIVIPLMLLLVLIIYYLLSLARSLREANKDLKMQLRRERTEERKKAFQVTNGHQPGTDMASKWPAVMKKILPVLPNKKSFPDIEKIKQDSEDSKGSNGEEKKKKTQPRLILMSDDDIFIETDQDSSQVTITDETKEKKGKEVPTITISKVKDEGKSDKKKKSKDEKKEKKGKEEKKTKEEKKKEDKKSKEDKKNKEDKQSKKGKKDKKSDEETESDQKALIEKDKKKKKEEEKLRKLEEKKRKEEEKKRKEEEKKKKDTKLRKEDKNKKNEAKEEKRKEEKPKKDEDKPKTEQLKEKVKETKTEEKRKEPEIEPTELNDKETPRLEPAPEGAEPTEEIELDLIAQEETETESDPEPKQISALKGDGMFEKDTTPLVIEFGTPSSMGSIQSTSSKVQDEYDVSDRTILLQNEQQVGRDTPIAKETSLQDTEES